MSIWVELDFKDYLVDPSAMLMGSIFSGFSKAAAGAHMEGRDTEREHSLRGESRAGQGWLVVVKF